MTHVHLVCDTLWARKHKWSQR